MLQYSDLLSSSFFGNLDTLKVKRLSLKELYRDTNLTVIHFYLLVHFLDKEAGVIIDKFFGTKAESECRESEGLQKNGSLQTENGIQELAESGNDQSKDISKEESTTDNLSRKLFEVK